MGGWGRHFGKRVLRPVLDLGTQGVPASPLALSGPQFPCLRSSMLGSWDLAAWAAVSRGLGVCGWGAVRDHCRTSGMDRQGEKGHTGQTFLGTHCIWSNSQGGIFQLLVADGATSVVKGLLTSAETSRPQVWLSR